MSILSQSYFHNEQAAYDFVESRLWPHGPTCPKCQERERVGKMGGESTRIGVYKCYVCRKPFTVKIGTIFESSHVALRLWLQAIYLIASSKKGVSSNQLHRTLGITLKSAWFMSHRIRESMREGGFASFGGSGSIVEVDETFIGNDKTKKPKARGYAHKHKILSLVDRDRGKARSMVIDDLQAKTIVPILRDNIDRESQIMTDDAGQYINLRNDFAAHEVVRHSLGEYGRGAIHTNTLEGFFSIFKRGMRGVYQHCAKRHLHRYVAEFDFRYNYRVRHKIDDNERADLLLRGVVGKRLTYQTTAQ